MVGGSIVFFMVGVKGVIECVYIWRGGLCRVLEITVRSLLFILRVMGMVLEEF